MPPFYGCPNCEKEISCATDTEHSSLLAGWGAFLKDKCPFCGTKVSVNWEHYAISVFIIIGFVAICFLIGVTILSGTSGDSQTALGLIMFCTSMPIGMILFYVLLPITFGKIGLKFYKENK